MNRPDPILAARRRLGPMSRHTLAAASLVDAHSALGELVAAPAARAIQRRAAAAGAESFARQIAAMRANRAYMQRCGAQASVPMALRRAIEEYFACLDAWADAVGVSPDHAMWAQDDNVGCQTGMLRQPDGSVVAWHTEEDTIGDFDRPRLVSFVVGDLARAAFIYPCLLPGPAFGWQEGRLYMVDSLRRRREPEALGSLTNVAVWLVWRLGAEVPPTQVCSALSPFLDACAINVVEARRSSAAATTYEIGGRHAQIRRLGAHPGSLQIQVNAIHDKASPLGQEEALSARDRAPYERRVERTRRAFAAKSDAGPAYVLQLMAGRVGNAYAYANTDVLSHCIAVVSKAGIALHLEVGAALATDELALAPSGVHSSRLAI